MVFALRLYFSLLWPSEPLELWESSKPKEKCETFTLGAHDCALVLIQAAFQHTITSAPIKFSVFYTHLIEGVEV